MLLDVGSVVYGLCPVSDVVAALTEGFMYRKRREACPVQTFTVVLGYTEVHDHVGLQCRNDAITQVILGDILLALNIVALRLHVDLEGLCLTVA